MNYKHNYIYSLVILMVMLAACSSSRKYQRPDEGIPATYNASVTSADSSLANRPWKEFFTDTTLVRLIDQALAHNFDLQLAIKRTETYTQMAKQARLAWLPALQLQATTSTVNPSQNSLNGISLSRFLEMNHLEDYSIGGTLSWELDIWGKIKKRKQAALADYLQSFEARNAVRTVVIAQVADAYYNLLMMHEQLKIAQRNLQLNDSLSQIMVLQQEAGEVTSLAVEQSVAQKQSTELLVHQLEQAVRIQENGLRLLLADWPGEMTLSKQLDDITPDSSFATGVPADLLRFRPDVRASEQSLKAANARVGVAQANLYPSLNLTAAGGLNAYQSSQWFTVPASLFGNLAGSLTQPIFERRARKTQLEVAKIEREQKVIEFRQSVTVAVHEVTNALVKLENLKSQRSSADQRVQTLRGAVAQAQLLFQSGMADYLEVITAQRSALDAELEKAIIARQQLSAHVELYKALGGGWM